MTSSLDRASVRRVSFSHLFKRAKTGELSATTGGHEAFAGTPLPSRPRRNNRGPKQGLTGSHEATPCSEEEEQQQHRENCSSPVSDDSDSEPYAPRRSNSFFRCFRGSRSHNNGRRMGSNTSRDNQSSRRCPSDSVAAASSAPACLSNEEVSLDPAVSRFGSFYTVISDADALVRRDSLSYMDDFLSCCDEDDEEKLVIEHGTPSTSPGGLQTSDDKLSTHNTGPQHGAATAANCSCGYPSHQASFDPEFPLLTPPQCIPNSYEETLAVARSCQGQWITILERSQTLDPQYRLLGLGMVKRTVMNRLAVPLTMFLEENDTILHCWIHTPLGIRHMRSNLQGKESEDDDPDAGRWKGVTSIVDYSVPWFCESTTVRAVQQRRENPKVGTCIETRVVLPDPAERKVMLFNFTMIPKGKTEKDKLSADRILRLVSSDLPEGTT